MNKQPVINILKDIFKAYGYDVDSSSYICDIVASKEHSDRIYIKLDMAIDYNSMRTFADSMKHTEGTGLYILNNSALCEVLDFAAQHDMVLWDRQELERHIGKAILTNAEGGSMSLTLIKPSDEKPFNVLDTQASGPNKRPFSILDESSSSKPEPKFKWTDIPSSEVFGKYQTHKINNEEHIVTLPLPSLTINITKTSAIKIGQAKIGEVQDFLLKFIPHYSYNYDFATKRKFRSKDIDLTGKGEGMVNAITGENKFIQVPQPIEHVEIPTENYQIKEPQFTEKEGVETAIDAIITKHTKNMKVDEVKGDAIVSESKTFSPSEKDINFTSHLFYIPIWEIQGRRNTVEINAHDGHILEEPVDDDAEFV
jgi:hypothetical protein